MSLCDSGIFFDFLKRGLTVVWVGGSAFGRISYGVFLAYMGFERFFSFYASAQWLSLSPTGLEPFIGLGFGAMVAKRNQIDLHSGYVDYLPIPEKKQMIPQAGLESGVTYETGPSGQIACRIGLCCFYNITGRGLVEASMFGLTTGVIFNVQ